MAGSAGKAEFAGGTPRLSRPTLNGNCATRTSRWPPSASLASSVTGVSAASVATGAEAMTDSVLYIPLSQAISMPPRRRGLNSLSCRRLGDSDCAGAGVCGLNLLQYRQTHLQFRSPGRFPVGNGRSGAVRANDTETAAIGQGGSPPSLCVSTSIPAGNRSDHTRAMSSESRILRARTATMAAGNSP